MSERGVYDNWLFLDDKPLEELEDNLAEALTGCDTKLTFKASKALDLWYMRVLKERRKRDEA